jgi:cell division transport system ATP-binding protein
LIEFDRVSRRHGDQHALRNLNLAVDQGEMTFLTGHSGAGKSTVLKLLLLLDRPTGWRDQGQWRSDNAFNLVVRSARYRRRFGVVFQDHRLLFDRSVHDNVALPLEIAGLFSSRHNPQGESSSG